MYVPVMRATCSSSVVKDGMPTVHNFLRGDLKAGDLHRSFISPVALVTSPMRCVYSEL